MSINGRVPSFASNQMIAESVDGSNTDFNYLPVYSYIYIYSLESIIASKLTYLKSRMSPCMIVYMIKLDRVR